MRLIVLISLLLFTFAGKAQPMADSVLLKQKHVKAYRIQSPIDIDGNLNESYWAEAPCASEFIQNFPVPGSHMRFNTEVAVLFDDEALYIGAWLYDPAPDSVLKQLSQRDVNANCDMFFVSIDTYNDDQNIFDFGVQASGVQSDARGSSNNYDTEWNAVWLSRVRIYDQGWMVEMKIPFSAIRFSEDKEQIWGINFTRNIRRFREEGTWNYMDPAISGVANQYGDLEEIRQIKSPLRLSLIPYASAYYNRYDDSRINLHQGELTYNAGLDLKYGINDAFTLDMTLVPDFGQVQSDNIVFNTTPFEVQFNEFRQFFTEGTELFNKADIFYSRRIGGFPVNYGAAYDSLKNNETIRINPSSTRTLNATKISGRTRGGTGLGVFNAVSAAQHAVLRDSLGSERNIETNPLTNYNVFVFDQNLKNNSYINITNGSVLRSGSTYDANVTSVSTNLNTKQNKYGFTGQGVLSQLYFPGRNPLLGHRARLQAGKYSGNYRFDAVYEEMSDTYDPNDIGFLYNNNKRALDLFFRYNMYEPRGRFLNWWVGANLYHVRLFAPDKPVETGFYGWMGGTTKKWYTHTNEFSIIPAPAYDYFEPRVPGRFLKLNGKFSYNQFLSTDYRKRFAVDISANINSYFNSDWLTWFLRVSPRFRFSDKLMLIHTTIFRKSYNEQASALDRFGSPTIIGDSIIFSKRNGDLVENILEINYIFTNRMALSFRCRHYWYALNYQSFHLLQTDGNLGETSYTGLGADGVSLHDNNFNAFNIDMVYTWVFAPGSELRVVWKSSIYSDLDSEVRGYFDNLEGTLNAGKTNSFSVKLLFYLDVNRLKQKKYKN